MADLTKQCWRAFEHGNKEDALRLLPKVQQPDQHFVHYATWHGWRDVCQQLVEKYQLSPSNEADILGGRDRPLHLACSSGRVEVVKYLLTLPSVLLTVNECDGGGLSALDLACTHEHLSVIKLLLKEPLVRIPNHHLLSDKFSVLSLLCRRVIWSTEFPCRSYFPVFMAGNTAAGKTTLTKAMLQLTQYNRSRHDGETVTGVKTLTAGICPSQCSG